MSQAYSPTSVEQLADRITAGTERLLRETAAGGLPIERSSIATPTD
ncbi:hypothetical protein [Natrinema salinisoli]|nr:hypothetical protein [Natrinema salinisoli]